MRPKAVMMENVPGLAKDHRIEKVTAALNSMGYTLVRDVLDAADYGVPQRRRRFILMAVRGATIAFPTKASIPKTVRDAFSALSVNQAQFDSLHGYLKTAARKFEL